MRWLLTWCGVCAVLAAPVAAQPQPNLLANSGFEEIGPDGKPLQWSLLGKGELVTDEKLAHGGKHYARVRFEDCAIQTVPIEPNTYYFVEGFVRGEKPDTDEVPRIKVYFQNAAGKSSLIAGGYITKPSYRDWQPFRITLRSPQDGASVAVRLIGQFNGYDWFHFDEVTMRKVPMREWPAAADLPDVNGQTVVVPDLEDVWSFAMYRVPPAAQAPIDGLLTTQAWTARAQEVLSRPPTCDFDIRFRRPVNTSWVLIHAISPDERLGQAALFTLPPDRHDEGRKLLDISAGDNVIHSLRLKPQPLPGLRVRLYGTDRRTALVQEIQAFGVRPGLTEQGAAVRFGTGAPREGERAALEALYANDEDRQALVGGLDARPTAEAPSASPLTVKAGKTLSLFADVTGGKACGVKSVTLRVQPQGLPAGSVVEVCLKQPAELDLNLGYAELTDSREERADQPRENDDSGQFHGQPPPCRRARYHTLSSAGVTVNWYKYRGGARP